MGVNSKEKLIPVEGIKLWTKSEGQGTPILLCNGGPGDGDYLQPVSDMISEISQVIRFEQRGCGRSGINRLYGLETCLQDLEAIRKSYNFDRWVIGGHSWGADLALAYALHYPENVSGLISISGTGVQNDRDWKEEYNKGRAEDREKIPKMDYQPNKEVNKSVIQSWRRFIKDPELLLKISKISCPSLFLYAGKDIRPSWPVEQIANLIPFGAFEVIEEAGHYMWLSHELDMKRILRIFLLSNFKEGISVT